MASSSSSASTLPTHDNGNRVIPLKVGGKLFALDENDVVLFGSDFLTKLVEEDSPFLRPEDGTYVVDADPHWFSIFLHLARSDGLLQVVGGGSDSNKEEALQQADFWGIQPKVSNKLLLESAIRREGYDKGYEIRDLEQKVQESKKHHNYRYDDGCGRVFCVDCRNRDIDSRFDEAKYVVGVFGGGGSPQIIEATKYTNCLRCKSEIRYKPNLNWCHKCRLCKKCQSYVGCPADNNCTRPRKHTVMKSTAQHKQELAKAKSDIQK